MNLPNLPLDVDQIQIQIQMGLCRLASAAKLAKLSPEMLEKGIEDGVIPLELIHIGTRLKYVRYIDLAAWLSGKTPR